MPYSSTRSSDGFTAEDRSTLLKLVEYVKKNNEKMTKLVKCVKKSQEVILEQNAEINSLRSFINLNNYRIDSQEQYGRREAFKAINVEGLGEDPQQIIFDICKEIEEKAPPYEGNKVSINLQPNDIHRCHFIGKGSKKKIICKLTPAAYKKKMKIMKTKRYVNQLTTGKFKSLFIAEDLTPVRSRLVWFIKNSFKDKYHKVHTRNGVIKMKLKSDDTNDGEWISVNNPDDLHKLVGDYFDVQEFNKGLRAYQILPCRPAPIIEDVFDDEEEFALF